MAEKAAGGRWHALEEVLKRKSYCPSLLVYGSGIRESRVSLDQCQPAAARSEASKGGGTADFVLAVPPMVGTVVGSPPLGVRPSLGSGLQRPIVSRQ